MGHHHHKPTYPLCGACHWVGGEIFQVVSHDACAAVVPEVTGECAAAVAAALAPELAPFCALLPWAGEVGCQEAERAGRADHWEHYVTGQICSRMDMCK